MPNVRKSHGNIEMSCHCLSLAMVLFYSNEASDEFETFCWTKLLLYKPFRNIP
jgi:hypothetical protein